MLEAPRLRLSFAALLGDVPRTLWRVASRFVRLGHQAEVVRLRLRSAPCPTCGGGPGQLVEPVCGCKAVRQ
jgi:hypothetical protein